MEYIKEYVRVNADIDVDGNKRPNKIVFENEEEYEIDKLKYRIRAASTKVGGCGIRYTVSIQGTETFLFEEDEGKWFVEKKKGL